MTRCTLLDEWFDAKSKKIEEIESETGICFATGKKK